VTVLFDTNVLIDAAVASRSYHGAAVRLMAHAEQGEIDGLYAPLSVGTCWYVAYEKEGVDPRSLFRFLTDTMRSVPMDRSVLIQALRNPGTEDFEDAYLAAAGLSAGADAIVTRNQTDFADTDLLPYHPLDLLRMLTSQES
jgi:predicted nucleic acid-binding protein